MDGMIGVWIGCVALVCAGFGAACSTLAAKKGYTGYFGSGFFFWFFALIYVAGLPDKTHDLDEITRLLKVIAEDTKPQRIREAQPTADTNPLTSCAKDTANDDSARKPRHGAKA